MFCTAGLQISVHAINVYLPVSCTALNFSYVDGHPLRVFNPPQLPAGEERSGVGDGKGKVTFVEEIIVAACTLISAIDAEGL